MDRFSIKTACDALAGTAAWVVGGSLRDELLGIDSYDLDIAVKGDPEKAAKRLRQQFGGSIFQLSDDFGTWRVVGQDAKWQIDLSPLQGESIEADLARRDFTVNAMARAVNGSEVIDLYSGKEDLANGVLRPVSERSFTDDPLRVMRLARLSCQFELTPSSECLKLASSTAEQLIDTAAERVFDELKLTVIADRPVEGIELLDQVGALKTVLPELSELKGVGQSEYHHLDVFDHTLAVLTELIGLQNGSRALLGDDAEAIDGYLSSQLADGLTRWQALRFAALLHDVAKPLTRKESEGRVTFYTHDVVGAKMARELMKRLKSSQKLREYVAALTRNHLKFSYLVHEDSLDSAQLYTVLTECSPVEVDLIPLSLADRLATKGKDSKQATEQYVELIHRLTQPVLNWQEYGNQEPLIRGDRLAESLDIEEGPLLGKLLKAVDQARYSGKITTDKQAVKFAGELLREQDS